MRRVGLAFVVMTCVVCGAGAEPVPPPASPTPAGAAAEAQPSAPSLRLASRLLDLMQVERQFEAQTAYLRSSGFAGAVAQAFPAAQDKPQLGDLGTDLMEIVEREVGWENMRDDVMRLYATTFTEDELRGLVTFYESPVGKTLVAKSPELAQKTMEMSMARMAALRPKIEALLQRRFSAPNAGTPSAPAP